MNARERPTRNTRPPQHLDDYITDMSNLFLDDDADNNSSHNEANENLEIEVFNDEEMHSPEKQPLTKPTRNIDTTVHRRVTRSQTVEISE